MRLHDAAMVVPESGPVKAQAEQELLDRVFIEAGCIPAVGGNLVRADGAASGRRSHGV